MNLDLLHTFLEVTRAGSLRRAATSLHRTQPALSARMRALERQLGARLFDRAGRRLRLTEAGEIVAAEAPALLAALESMRRRIDDLESGGGTLRLATIDAASIYVLPKLYLEYRQRHPRVQLVVQVVDSRRVLAAVVDGDADIGVLVLPARHPEAIVQPFFEDRLAVVAAPSHPLGHRASTTLAAVASQPLVLYGRSSATRAILDSVFRDHDLVPNVAMETASPEAMKRLAEVGVGLAIVPEALVRSEVAAGRLRALALRDARFTRWLGVAVRRGRTLPVAAHAFLALLGERHPPLAAAPPPPPRKRRGAHPRR